MSKQDMGASADAETGSRERGQEVVPALAGFDPARRVGELIAAGAAYIAPRLGPAQRRVILSLTEDWGKAACGKTARRMFYGVTDRAYTVIHHKHCTDNCWRLSDLGVAVKAAIAMEAATAGETCNRLDPKDDSAGRNGIARPGGLNDPIN